MINRVLIRMKTVQLLYSYLLVEKPFSLESQPSAPTKEKRFAYNLYLDLVYLMDKISHEVVGKNKLRPLEQSRFIQRIEGDDRLKSLKIKYSGESFPFASAIPSLAEEIKESLLFREYERNWREGITTDNFWENIFNAVILQNQQVKRIISDLPEYTLAGFERMRDMMSVTFKNFYATKDDLGDALKTLEMSMQKARDLYMRLLALPVEITNLRLEQLENNRNKIFATNEDLNPNMKLVNNEIPQMIENNSEFQQYVEANHLSWKAEDPELLDLLLKRILESETYKRYLEENKKDITLDSEFWKDIFVDVILNDRNFLEYLENKSVFWNDDLEIMCSFVLKSLKRMENPETASSAVMPMYKDGDHGKDAKFGADLFRYVVKNKDLYKGYIETALQEDKWEADRLAFMDVVIIMTALAEIINYPEIPLNVSINEYIEIAKSYSSAKSGQFVHGLLASIIPHLREQRIILK